MNKLLKITIKLEVKKCSLFDQLKTVKKQSGLEPQVKNVLAQIFTWTNKPFNEQKYQKISGALEILHAQFH